MLTGAGELYFVINTTKQNRMRIRDDKEVNCLSLALTI